VWPLVLVALGALGLYWLIDSGQASPGSGVGEFWALAGLGVFLFLMLAGLGLFVRNARKG